MSEQRLNVPVEDCLPGVVLACAAAQAMRRTPFDPGQDQLGHVHWILIRVEKDDVLTADVHLYHGQAQLSHQSVARTHSALVALLGQAEKLDLQF